MAHTTTRTLRAARVIHRAKRRIARQVCLFAALRRKLISDVARHFVLTHDVESVVKRPTFGKSRKRSSLRMSFGPGDSDINDGDESSDAVVTPKKSNLKIGRAHV